VSTVLHSSKQTPAVSNRGLFHALAKRVAAWSGHPATFGLAVGLIVVWALLGTVFHFSDTWQLVINTATTIVTFLMVFLIQNTQNRDTAAMQIKLDELIRAAHGARNDLLDLEELDDQQLLELKKLYEHLAEKARRRSEKRQKNTVSQ
jgi:low affinity Fe/Cu permease